MLLQVGVPRSLSDMKVREGTAVGNQILGVHCTRECEGAAEHGQPPWSSSNDGGALNLYLH